GGRLSVTPARPKVVQWSNQFLHRPNGESTAEIEPEPNGAEMRHSVLLVQLWMRDGVAATRALRQRANNSSRTRLEPASRSFASARTAGEASAGVPERKGGAGAYSSESCTVSA